ncbi:LrgB family protein [Alteribacillus bidgolensis]|uniref:Putative effector of murein hydrolase n=1 Tax=Alteribacillus bidgolensis TaxID=930129 RepID=A0A1G8HEB5_9BACI|nr:LrgB family protein [Alteribacillus bidgolensis]SDI04800.1 Putative effector of murein hydrolase [Alteribacillus bidgolensis]
MVTNLVFSTLLTVTSYAVGLKVFRRYHKPWLNPLYTATIFLVLVLVFVPSVNYESYLQITDVFSFLLGIATISLAVPLYKQILVLKKHAKKICLGVMLGSAGGILSGLVLAKWLLFQDKILLSLISKSVTIPVALSVTDMLGGIPSLTVLFALSSALFSLMLGPKILQMAGIKSKVAKGMALGASAQALGVNRALQWGEEEGSMGSVAMCTSAVFLSILVPFLGLVVH